MIGALKGNVGKMELVAMELKQSGCYLARTLSYEVGGVLGGRSVLPGGEGGGGEE